MLVLTRHADAGDKSAITIGATIVITVLSVSGDQVRLGVSAPADVRVDRREIWDQRQLGQDQSSI